MPIDFKAKTIKYNDAVGFNTHVIIFFTEKDKKNNKIFYKYQLFNSSTLQPEGEAMVFAETAYKIKFIFPIPFYGLAKDHRGFINFASSIGVLSHAISSDHKTLTIVRSERLEYKMETVPLRVRIFDEDFNETKSQKVTLPVSPKEFSLEGMLTSNSGDVFVLGRTEKEIPKQKGIKPRDRLHDDYSFYVFRINPVTGKVKKFTLHLAGAYILNASFTMLNDEIVFSGLYSNSPTSGADGLFYLTMDPQTVSIKTQELNPFTPAIFENINPSKNKSEEDSL